MPGYGTPLGLTLPVPSTDTEAATANKINTALSAIITRLESKVAATDLDIASDVSFKSGAVFSGATGLHRAAFQSQSSALTAVSNPNTVYVLNGDLHYIDASGNLVQITASGAVNVSTTGGITGAGYGTGGVEVNWDSANTRFSFRSGAGTDDYADVQCADVLLRDGSSHQIRFQAPAIASDYTLSLPSALPGSTSLLQVTSAGLMSASNTVSQAVTLSALLTANGGVTLASGQHVTLSGAGTYKRGQVARTVAATAGTVIAGTVTYGTGTLTMTADPTQLQYSLPINENERLVEVSARVIPGATGAAALAVFQISTAGVATQVGSTASSSGSASQVLTVATNITADVTLVARIIQQGADDCQVVRLTYTTDVP